VAVDTAGPAQHPDENPQEDELAALERELEQLWQLVDRLPEAPAALGQPVELEELDEDPQAPRPARAARQEILPLVNPPGGGTVAVGEFGGVGDGRWFGGGGQLLDGLAVSP
jgi:hypothetical protein